MDRLRILTVHGTGDGEPGEDDKKWWEAGSDFADALCAALTAEGFTPELRAVQWSGDNTIAGRLAGARATHAAWQQENCPTLVIGHSHGGNVATDAARAISARDGAPAASIMTIGTPFLSWRFSIGSEILSRLIQLAFLLGAAAWMFEFWVDIPRNTAIGYELLAYISIEGLALALALITFALVAALWLRRVARTIRLAIVDRRYRRANPMPVHCAAHSIDEAITLLRHAFELRTQINFGREIRKNLFAIIPLAPLVGAIWIAGGWVYDVTTASAEGVFAHSDIALYLREVDAPVLERFETAFRYPSAGLVPDLIQSSLQLTIIAAPALLVFLFFASFITTLPLNTLLGDALRTAAFGSDGRYRITDVGSEPQRSVFRPFDFDGEWEEHVREITAQRASNFLDLVRMRAVDVADVSQLMDQFFEPGAFETLIHTSYFERGSSRATIIDKAVEIARTELRG